MANNTNSLTVDLHEFSSPTPTPHPSNSSLTFSSSSLPMRQSPASAVFFTLAYLFIFVATVLGNSAVILIVVRVPGMRSVINLFICNLSVADLLSAVFVMPVTLVQTLFNNWPLGEFLCRLSPFLQGLSVCTSVCTLTTVAFDRYLAICRPFRHIIHRREALIIIFCSWGLSALLLVPWLLYYRLIPQSDNETNDTLTTYYICSQVWPGGGNGFIYFVSVIFITYYCLPLTLISGFYCAITRKLWRRTQPAEAVDRLSRGGSSAQEPSVNGERECILSSPRQEHLSYPPGGSSVCGRAYGGLTREKSRRVVRMLFLVVLLFALSWLPLYVFFIVLQVAVNLGYADTFVLPDITLPLCQLLGSLNSCVNPWIYCLYSKSYKEGFKYIFMCHSLRELRRRRTLQNQISFGSSFLGVHGIPCSNRASSTSYKLHALGHRNPSPQEPLAPPLE